MNEESIDYGNWVPKKLTTILSILVTILTTVSILMYPLSINIIITNGFIFPLYLTLNIVLWVIDVFIIVGFVYFVFLYRAFSVNNGELQNQIRDVVLEKLQWDGKGKALDIGTGSGYLAIQMAKPSPHSEVIGIDYWGKTWNYSQQICEKNAKIEGVRERTRFQRASASSLPFETGELDAIVSNLVFHNIMSVKDKSELFKEALRVLKKGGVFSIQDTIKNEKRYGNFEQLKKKIIECGITELHYMDTNEIIEMPRAARLELKSMGIFYGIK